MNIRSVLLTAALPIAIPAFAHHSDAALEMDREIEIDGTVVEINDALSDDPETITSDPYGDGWIVKLEPAGDIDDGSMLTPAAYQELLDQEEA